MNGPATVALLACMVAMGSVPVVTSGRVLTPDQYLKLKLAYELANTVRQPRDRCTPPPVDYDAPRPRPNGAECNLRYGSVPFGGECYDLLKQGPCSASQWLVQDHNTERAICQFQVCPNHHVLVSGVCALLGTADADRHCPKTLQLIINEYGEAECECPVRQVYHPRTGRCYPLFEQGPCRNGNSVQIVDGGHGSYADCLPSLCPASGQVPMTPLCELAKTTSSSTQGSENYQCYNMSTKGPCNDGSLQLDLSVLDVVCSFDEIYGLFNSLPGRPCSRGSRRDSLGRCRRDLPSNGSPDVTTMPPTVKPGLYDNGSVCPDAYVFLSGTCLQIVPGT